MLGSRPDISQPWSWSPDFHYGLDNQIIKLPKAYFCEHAPDILRRVVGVTDLCSTQRYIHDYRAQSSKSTRPWLYAVGNEIIRIAAHNRLRNYCCGVLYDYNVHNIIHCPTANNSVLLYTHTDILAGFVMSNDERSGASAAPIVTDITAVTRTITPLVLWTT